jgi:hypothetical protein
MLLAARMVVELRTVVPPLTVSVWPLATCCVPAAAWKVRPALSIDRL